MAVTLWHLPVSAWELTAIFPCQLFWNRRPLLGHLLTTMVARWQSLALGRLWPNFVGQGPDCCYLGHWFWASMSLRSLIWAVSRMQNCLISPSHMACALDQRKDLRFCLDGCFSCYSSAIYFRSLSDSESGRFHECVLSWCTLYLACLFYLCLWTNRQFVSWIPLGQSCHFHTRPS